MHPLHVLLTVFFPFYDFNLHVHFYLWLYLHCGPCGTVLHFQN